MSTSNYVITLPLGTNGSPLTVNVVPGFINTDYSIGLAGRGAPGYGQVFAQNALLQLTNNASNSTGRPSNPLIGQIWYNDTNKQLMHFVGFQSDGVTPVGGADQYGWSGVMSTTGAASGSAASLTISGGGTGASNPTQALLNLGGVNKSGDALTGFLRVTTHGAISAGSSSAPTLLTASFNEVTIASGSSTYVQLPVAVAGMEITVLNETGTSINVLPNTGDHIESNPNAVPVPMGPGTRLKFVAATALKWYMMTAVYAQ